jgi:hypothetical protein
VGGEAGTQTGPGLGAIPQVNSTEPTVADSLLMRLDPEVALLCFAGITTLVSHSTETKRGMNGLRRPSGLFEVDGVRRNDFYLFSEVGSGPMAHLFSPFFTSAKFNGSTTLSHAAVLCPERNAVFCRLASLVSDYFGLDGMVAVLLQVIREGAAHTLSAHHDRPDWSAVVSVTLGGDTTFLSWARRITCRCLEATPGVFVTPEDTALRIIPSTVTASLAPPGLQSSSDSSSDLHQRPAPWC